MNSPQSRNVGSRFFSAFQSPLGAAVLAILAIVVILMNAGHAAAPGPAQGSASVTIVGPLPVPIDGTVKIDSSANTVQVAGTTPVSFAAPTLFRGKLLDNGPDNPKETITNDTSQSLVIDFANAPGEALVLLVSVPGGEQHVYFFAGHTSPVTGFAATAHPTKIIVKPGETLARSGVGSAEVTGHYESGKD